MNKKVKKSEEKTCCCNEETCQCKCDCGKEGDCQCAESCSCIDEEHQGESSSDQEEKEPITAEIDMTETAEIDMTDYKAMYQRALADHENTRKRHEQDKKDLREYACQSVVEDLLPVVDNFYRATDHVPAESKESPWVTGIQYIQKQLLDVIEGYGVTEIPTKIGDKFDPTRHEAVGVNHNLEMEEDCILEVQSRGYLLGKRVMRPTKVIVNKLSK